MSCEEKNKKKKKTLINYAIKTPCLCFFMIGNNNECSIVVLCFIFHGNAEHDLMDDMSLLHE